MKNPFRLLALLVLAFTVSTAMAGTPDALSIGTHFSLEPRTRDIEISWLSDRVLDGKIVVRDIGVSGSASIFTCTRESCKDEKSNAVLYAGDRELTIVYPDTTFSYIHERFVSKRQTNTYSIITYYHYPTGWDTDTAAEEAIGRCRRDGWDLCRMKEMGSCRPGTCEQTNAMGVCVRASTFCDAPIDSIKLYEN